MTIAAVIREKNLAHTDMALYVDTVFSGVIRLWNEEVDGFLLRLERLNGMYGTPIAGQLGNGREKNIPEQMLELSQVASPPPKE
jgi:hypothetical protein